MAYRYHTKFTSFTGFSDQMSRHTIGNETGSLDHMTLNTMYIMIPYTTHCSIIVKQTKEEIQSVI